MNREITYTCRFCKNTRTFEADTEGAERLRMNVALWIKNLCCTRCAQYHNARIKLCGKIAFVCSTLANNQAGKNNGDINRAAETKIRQLTERLCQHICTHYGFETVHDPAFAEMLVEKPHRAGTIIRTYINGIINLPRCQAQPD
jgi:hypothetical protein